VKSKDNFISKDLHLQIKGFINKAVTEWTGVRLIKFIGKASSGQLTFYEIENYRKALNKVIRM
jgi:hypothetical protein